jgi:hypothetical protein
LQFGQQKQQNIQGLLLLAETGGIKLVLEKWFLTVQGAGYLQGLYCQPAECDWLNTDRSFGGRCEMDILLVISFRDTQGRLSIVF